ncbi:peptidylprolyl isomerase [Paracandidimonas soli]|uniref:Chaperone SurA n=1 Tax=Paracandidimonas soli TaxID=1917182 RepID=A0A4V2VSN8_9BURK|nr:peptidylprolyl isomerase [Paracandidimonas soli]TCV03140.1 periplasmic chaperone for outer membrane proteins SurA [Paracandidimonas soli]
MMFALPVKRRMAWVLVSAVGALSVPGLAHAQAQEPATRASGQFVDGIAAIVNKHVITMQELNAQLHIVQGQLQQQNIPAPDQETLQKQVLQRMIMEELEKQEADRLGVRVSEADVERALAEIAQRNQISVDQLRENVEKGGVSWNAYRQNLRDEVRIDMLRRDAVEHTIQISEADVDAFLRSQGYRPGAANQQTAPAQQSAALGLAHILVAVPEGSSSSRVAELRAKAQAILERARGGADFAGLAAASSDAPEALSGGDLGVRPVDGWPELFVQATRNLQPGQVSDIIQSGNGFHILKVTTRGSSAAPAQAQAQEQPSQEQGPMMVTQTHARHILIKTNQVVTDDQAQARLRQIQERLELGNESFEDLARRYSQDASGPQGGDLGWLSPGTTVPPFEQAMNALEPGQVSGLVKSPFGWHLIKVIERRTRNMENEYRRMQARQALFQRRADPAYEDWLNQLRTQAYIDNRLDPQSNRSRR